MNLVNPPRNALGDRAGPRYSLETFKLSVRAAEPGAKVDSPNAAVPVLRHILARLDADQEHFIVLALNTKLQITGSPIAASGVTHRRNAPPQEQPTVSRSHPARWRRP